MLNEKYQKTLFVIGGPNGSGKTTLARELVDSQNATYLSADDIAYELNPQNPFSVRIQAGKEFFRRLDDLGRREENIIIESTLSGKLLIPLVSRFKSEYRFNIAITFIYLSDEHMCAERVKVRVLRGGHFVPFEDIKRRFSRSMLNFWHEYRNHCDAWHLFYNS
ncbi:MAG: AAA family ATPase [Balneolales bacterium]|nr:AAA family ATPase [Balneolales bacterium]